MSKVTEQTAGQKLDLHTRFVTDFKPAFNKACAGIRNLDSCRDLNQVNIAIDLLQDFGIQVKKCLEIALDIVADVYEQFPNVQQKIGLLYKTDYQKQNCHNGQICAFCDNQIVDVVNNVKIPLIPHPKCHHWMHIVCIFETMLNNDQLAKCPDCNCLITLPIINKHKFEKNVVGVWKRMIIAALTFYNVTYQLQNKVVTVFNALGNILADNGKTDAVFVDAMIDDLKCYHLDLFNYHFHILADYIYWLCNENTQKFCNPSFHAMHL